MAASRYNQLCVVGFECFVFHFVYSILFLFNNLIFKYQTSFAALFRVFFLLPLPWCLPSFFQIQLYLYGSVLHSCVRLPVICCVPVCSSFLADIYQFDYCRLDGSIAEKLSCYSHGKNSGNQQWQQQRQQLKYYTFKWQ